ncbi:helix-hairpin-helix domain-containing protein [Zhihengliuella flava]|uniref:Competence protein ComEA n=1 Tax=Zhihengliuella flava TaxID=1285193 RepID=A0A931GDV0_9MICC|nr:competence protein ComEA [Zhihengliuella flava]
MLVWTLVSLLVRPWAGEGEVIGAVDLERSDPSAAASSAPPQPEIEEGTLTADEPSTGSGVGEQPSADADLILVHVAGAVHHPDVYKLPPGARVHEALTAAGGATEEASPASLNLAAEVHDGEQLYVPTLDEAAGARPPTGPGSGSEADAAEETVNVNLADAGALEELPGIGPALAERIVEFRERNGPFGALADLDAVSGIGPVLVEELADAVTF